MEKKRKKKLRVPGFHTYFLCLLEMQSTSQTTDVVIVGAGMAGLSAANELRQHGIEVVVVEANDRVGGRVQCQKTALGSFVDLGGQWIGHDHHRLVSLALRYNATMYQTYNKGLPIVIKKGQKISIFSTTFIAFIGLMILLLLVSKLPIISYWNGMSLEQFFGSLPDGNAKELFELIIAIVSCADPARVTPGSLLKHIRHNGGLMTILTDVGGAQDTLLQESLGSLALKLAEEVGNENILLSHPVSEIKQTENRSGVEVETINGRKIKAKKVIITVPPPKQDKITFTPPLPNQWIELQKNSFMGLIYKAVAVYPTPFWRKKNLSQFIVLDKPWRMCFDSSPPSGKNVVGHLAILIAGPDAHWMDKMDVEKRKQTILSSLVPFLGKEVLQISSWHDKAWHDEDYIGGGYEALYDIKAKQQRLPMRFEIEGNIHWAGTETADEHIGYVEGALQSGHRVAQEILSTIQKS